MNTVYVNNYYNFAKYAHILRKSSFATNWSNMIFMLMRMIMLDVNLR